MLPSTRCTPPVVDRLKEVLRTHPGTTEVQLKLVTRNGTQRLRLDDRLRVTADPALYGDLKHLLGPGCLGMTYPTATTEPTADPRSPSRTADVLRDVGIVLGWFLVAGVLGALLWWKLVDLPQATRAQGSVVVESDQLGKEVNIDGWFFVIAAVGGLVSGVVLTLWRRRDPLLVVVAGGPRRRPGVVRHAAARADPRAGARRSTPCATSPTAPMH